MLDKLQNHPVKTSTAFGGGLSIGLALYLFAPKGEVALLKDMLAAEHRDRMDSEVQYDAKFERIMLSKQATNSVLTAGGTGGRVPQ